MPSDDARVDSLMKKRHWHPYLIALYPAAFLYSANLSSVSLSDVLLPMALVIVGALIIRAVWSRACCDSERAAIAASWTIGWFFFYTPLSTVVNLGYREYLNDGSETPGEYVLILWGVVWLVGTACILRANRKLHIANQFLNSTALLLLAITAVSIASRWMFHSLTTQEASTESQVRETIVLGTPNHLPDIYYLVFDRYGGADTLKESFGWDNAGFYEELRHRGFFVAKESCANYPRTILSMASALNLCYLPEEVQTDRFYTQMIGNHRVGRLLTDIGYEYHHFGNWYQPLRSNGNATTVFQTSVLPSEYAESLYSTTPLSKLLPTHCKYEFVIEKFERVADIAKAEQPTFVYAHFLLPHNPYVLSPDGTKSPWSTRRYGDRKENYVGQLRGTNVLLLRTIDEIIGNSGTPPIIVLQADEGPYLGANEQQLDLKHQILVRSRILTAFLLPESENKSTISPSISPVNTFRFIFREYLGAKLDLLPDRSYYWEQADKLGRPAPKNKRYVDVSALIAD